MLSGHLQKVTEESLLQEFPKLLRHERDQYAGFHQHYNARTRVPDFAIKHVPQPIYFHNQTDNNIRQYVGSGASRKVAVNVASKVWKHVLGDALTIYYAGTDGKLDSFLSETQTVTSDNTLEYSIAVIEHIDLQGSLRDIKKLTSEIKSLHPEVLVCVESLQSYGVEEINFDQWGVDYLVTSVGNSSNILLVSKYELLESLALDEYDLEFDILVRINDAQQHNKLVKETLKQLQFDVDDCDSNGIICFTTDSEIEAEILLRSHDTYILRINPSETEAVDLFLANIQAA